MGQLAWSRRQQAKRGLLARIADIALPTCVLPEPLIDKVHHLMSGFRGAPVDIAFDRLARFNGNAVVLYGGTKSHAFRAVRQTLMARLIAILSVCKAADKVEGHMTVFYNNRAMQTRPVEAVRRRADEVFLIYSRKGSGRHIVLGRWPLQELPEDAVGG